MPVERDRLPGALATAYSSGIASCCQQAGIAFSDAICRTAAVASASAKFIDWNSPSANYDSAAAGRCRDAIAVAIATCSDLEQMGVLPNCYDIFIGTQPPSGTTPKPQSRWVRYSKSARWIRISDPRVCGCRVSACSDCPRSD